jgi:hypothetical protein
MSFKRAAGQKAKTFSHQEDFSSAEFGDIVFNYRISENDYVCRGDKTFTTFGFDSTGVGYIGRNISAHCADPIEFYYDVVPSWFEALRGVELDPVVHHDVILRYAAVDANASDEVWLEYGRGAGLQKLRIGAKAADQETIDELFARLTPHELNASTN